MRQLLTMTGVMVAAVCGVASAAHGWDLGGVQCLAGYEVVPEPLTMITLAAGVGGLATYVRKRVRGRPQDADHR